MPYIVLVGGAVWIILIWVTYIRFRDRTMAGEVDPVVVRMRSSQVSQRRTSSIIGTVALGAAMWFWGVQAIQEANATAARQQLWLATFTDEHRRAWNDGCVDILTNLGDGVLYDEQTGQAYDIAWCKERWSPPKQPTRYSSYDADQPDRTPPFPSQALFGENTGQVRCSDKARTDCFTWDDFVVPPPPDYP